MTGIFNKIAAYNIEHIYNTSFPEGKLHRYQIEIGGKTKEELKAELTPPTYYVSDWANRLMEHHDFTVLKHTEEADLVRLTVKDLGLAESATTDKIYKKAEELGLELCPAETGPHLRLAYSGSDWIYIAMKQITGRVGDPSVFDLSREGAGLRLDGWNAEPDEWWGADARFVFLLRKKKL